MPLTQVNTGQIFDGGVQRLDLCTTVAGKSVIAKAIQGTAIKITATGADAGTGDATISLDTASDLGLAAAQNITVNDGSTNASVNVITIVHNSSGTPTTGFGTGLMFSAETDTTLSQQMGGIQCIWSTVTQASRSAYMDFLLENAGGLGPTTKMRLFPTGGLSVGTTTDPNANGVINAFTGFRVSNAAPLGQVLRGNGTNFINSTLAFSDLTGAATVGQLPVSSDFGFTSMQTHGITNTNTNTDDSLLRLKHNLSSGTPAAGMGATIWFSCQSNNVQDRDQGQLYTAWSTATDASRASYMGFRTVTATAMNEQMRLWGSGGLHVGATGIGTDPGSGIIDAATGFKVGGSAATLGNLLSGDGTQFTSKATARTMTTNAAGPAGTVSTTGVMAGLAGSITPTRSGAIVIIITCAAKNTAAGTGLSQIRYGTGTAPTNGAALTGTAVGNSSGSGTVAGTFYGCTMIAVVTGLTVGTAYWVDCSLASSVGTNTYSINNVGLIAFEV